MSQRSNSMSQRINSMSQRINSMSQRSNSMSQRSNSMSQRSNSMSSQPTYVYNGETKPMCSYCGFKTSWEYIQDCNKCKSYLCNICESSKNCKVCKK